MSKIFPCCPLSVISKGIDSCNRDALPSLQMTFLTVVESLSAEKERETDRQRQRDRQRGREGETDRQIDGQTDREEDMAH